MYDKSVVHELDALDLAALWPLGGQPSLAPVHSATDGQIISTTDGGRRLTGMSGIVGDHSS